jgi:hypothetical protein
LLGAADFSPTGRSLDAARIHAATGAWDFEGLAAFLDTPRPLGPAFSDANGQTITWGSQLYGVLAHWSFDPIFQIEALGLARIVSSNNSFPTDASVFGTARSQGETYTGSLRIHGDSKGWVYSAMGAFQGGALLLPQSGTPIIRTRERMAGAAAGFFGKTFDGLIWTPTLTAIGSFATGDSGTGTYNQFDPILPDVHTHHGIMNVFALSNLFDVGGKIQVNPFQNGKIGAEYRYAMLVDSHGDWLNGYLNAISGPPLGNGMHELGHEIDLAFNWRPHPALDIAAGYGALLLTGDAARNILRQQRRGDLQTDGSISVSPLSQFGYLQATVNIP